MSGLVISTDAQRARAAMEQRSGQLDAYNFDAMTQAEVQCEDGSVFRVSDSFLEEWIDPTSRVKWIFMFCEHYPAMFWAQDDLRYWANWTSKHVTNQAYS